MKKVCSIVLVLLLCLSGCGTDTPPAEGDTTQSTDKTTSTTVASGDMFTDRDKSASYGQNNDVAITLNGDAVVCQDSSVKVQGTTVTITKGGTYIITGTLQNGMLIVDAGEKDKPHLVLNGVSITSSTSAALYVREGDKIIVTLAEGTQNTLANGGTFTAIDDNDIDAAVFSKQDLSFNGSGNLTVTSPAGHGVVCKDDLVLMGGTYTVNAASHGLDANDSVRIAGITATVDAGKDGIRAENNDDASLGFVYIESGTLTVEAEGDGISAGAHLQVHGGTIDVTAGGGSANAQKQQSDSWGDFMGGRPGMRPRATEETSTDSTSMKGIKSGGDMHIAGGTIRIDSADDAVHSNASLTVGGGVFDIRTGDDGMHAEETLTVTGGVVTIHESYEGLEALHVRVQGGEITLTADDDGLNAAGGADQSGITGGRDGMFGERPSGGFGGGRQPGGFGGGNSNGSIVISGGVLNITASGDGIDANGTLEISGGNTVVCGPTQGDTATLDYDVSGIITGGTFIGTGAMGMAQNFSDAKQGVIAVRAGNCAAGTEIVLKDARGKTLLTHTPHLSFAVVILSSPEIQSGADYTLCIGSDTTQITAQ